MNQTEQLNEFLSVLNSFAEKTGINKFQNTTELDSILTSTEVDRGGWTETELHNKSFTLFSYSAYLKRCENQQVIKLKWAQSNIRVLYGKECQKYDRFSYVEKQDAAIADQESIKALHSIIMNAETRIAQLQDIAGYVSKMAYSLTEMGKSRRADKYERNA